MSGKYVLFIGRWSPFHNGHKFIIDTYIDNKVPVCIAIRESIEVYTVSDRMLMIQAVYKDKISEGLVKVISIPDISGVAVGRKVGYFLIEVPQSIRVISGSDVRDSIEAKKDEYGFWRDQVPPEVQEVLDYIHSGRDKGDNSE